MAASSLTPPAPCSCRRITPHLHYSSNHDFSVGMGLACLLVVEGLAFLAGIIKGSTFLYPSTMERFAYEWVAQYAEPLLSPYEGLYTAAAIVELVALGLAIVAVATLHSIRRSSWHEIGATAGLILLFSLALNWIYVAVTERALRGLPDLVCSKFAFEQSFGTCSEMLETAAQVEEQFRAAYGFWGSTSYNALNLFLTLASLVFLVIAAFTTGAKTIWQPTEETRVIHGAPSFPRTQPVAESALGTVSAAAAPATPTKFCRFCGARIVRDSKFCEECGGKIV